MTEEEDDKIWTTKDGRRLAFSGLSDEHLMNVIRLLERKHAMQLLSYMGSDDSMMGDHAADAKNAEFDALMEEGPSHSDERYRVAIEEAGRRGLYDLKERQKYRDLVECALLQLVVSKVKP